jgi:hypothetical protein
VGWEGGNAWGSYPHEGGFAKKLSDLIEPPDDNIPMDFLNTTELSN